MCRAVLAVDRDAKVQGCSQAIEVGDTVVYLLSDDERRQDSLAKGKAESYTSRWSLPYLVTVVKDKAVGLQSYMGSKISVRQMPLRHVRKLDMDIPKSLRRLIGLSLVRDEERLKMRQNRKVKNKAGKEVVVTDADEVAVLATTEEATK
eukprot:GHVS01071579.1.p1 GENE.GHVS01071579.1~~GHVS01071579.1.p1  ORF type:complete len:149 (+),score=18.88 GHVS01071579.1:508-954(+)